MYRRLSLASFVLLVLSSLVLAPIVNALPHTDIDVDTAYQMITSGSYPNLVVLDVRTREEFDTGHIRKALLIPYTELEQRIMELAEHKNHEIIVYCFKGSRSEIACGILDSHGFTKVYNMLGGIDAWKVKGYPVATSYLTEIFFNISPNPAKMGQSVFLRGILVDQFSSPVRNETVEIYYRKGSGLWRFAANLTTNAYGIFAAAGKMRESGVYTLCTYYAGCATYEMSYEFAILIVQS